MLRGEGGTSKYIVGLPILSFFLLPLLGLSRMRKLLKSRPTAVPFVGKRRSLLIRLGGLFQHLTSGFNEDVAPPFIIVEEPSSFCFPMVTAVWSDQEE